MFVYDTKNATKIFYSVNYLKYQWEKHVKIISSQCAAGSTPACIVCTNEPWSKRAAIINAIAHILLHHNRSSTMFGYNRNWISLKLHKFSGLENQMHVSAKMLLVRTGFTRFTTFHWKMIPNEYCTQSQQHQVHFSKFHRWKLIEIRKWIFSHDIVIKSVRLLLTSLFNGIHYRSNCNETLIVVAGTGSAENE